MRVPEDKVKSMCELNNLQWDGVYINSKDPLKCICLKCKNTYCPTYNAMQQNKSGCPHCSRKAPPTKQTIEELCSKNQLRWDGVYKNIYTLLRCVCLVCHNEVHPRYNDLQQGKSGCKVCSRKAPPTKQTIEELCSKNRLRFVGDYTNSSTPLDCICLRCNNECHPRYNGLQRGQGGCRACSSGRSEKRLRGILEIMTSLKWPSSSPAWLKGQEGGGRHVRQIDCFCSLVKMVFEYHGEQHYEKGAYLNQRQARREKVAVEEVFQKQQARDARLRELCKANGYELHEIPYYWSWEKIEEYVRDVLGKAGLLIESPSVILGDEPSTEMGGR